MIAGSAAHPFDRMLAASLTLTFFVYVVVNIGMVSGLLPVVGVPLPLVSYGGTSAVTLMASLRFVDVYPCPQASAHLEPSARLD